MQAFLIQLENRPGAVADVSEAIAARGINITAVAGLATGAGGAMVITTDDEAGTVAALDAGGYPYRPLPVVTTALEHVPGSLAAATRRLADAGVNLEAMFPTGMADGRVMVAFAVGDAAAASRALG